jgi:hypothetical protein
MANRTLIAAAAAPLVRTAKGLDWPQRRAFLDDLRADAPALITEVERILASEAGACHVNEQGVVRSTVGQTCMKYLRALSPRFSH